MRTLTMLSSRRNANIQWKLLFLSFIVTLCAGGLVLLLNQTLLDVRDYYVYYGTTGPYIVNNTQGAIGGLDTAEIENKFTIGANSGNFHAGDWLAWTSDISIEKGVGVITTVTLYNLDLNEAMGIKEFYIPGKEKRTGERNNFFHLPQNIPPGRYELRRRAIFTPPHGISASQEFAPIPFAVVK